MNIKYNEKKRSSELLELILRVLWESVVCSNGSDGTKSFMIACPPPKKKCSSTIRREITQKKHCFTILLPICFRTDFVILSLLISF